MIYDSLGDIEKYNNLSSDIYEGLKFLKKVTPDLVVGTYQINSSIKAIVSEYETKRQNEYGFEAHKKYIDIQGMLTGKERVACLPIHRLRETVPYDEKIDAAFFTVDVNLQPSYFNLQPGYFAIFFPQDGHMPQLCVDESMMVKKVVIKVEIF